MSVDPNVLAALSEALESLKRDPQRPVPSGVIAALAPLAREGTNLKIDLEASHQIGAPLVTLGYSVPKTDLFAPLTPRQCDVAALLVCGQSNKEIARNLSISPATVKDHVHAILKRLNLPSRAAVMAAARSPEKASREDPR
ncbi:LuxR C-terminal-related transcriptional regulator [uncultured Roseibium sp.]|uniref:LuxR C-terminal-related transcriptional regulator n=1 Tax=uncultured Roseibium sp. TaxID=1936171 RepID=UPI00261E536D|nr:LuxR C-terminal-related transcriptional regulator [uncultured Roseibium sp.]